jgi:hypothetical protein
MEPWSNKMSTDIKSINQKDFEALAWAANEAKRQGDMETAHILDKLARKANGSLTNASLKEHAVWLTTNQNRIKWQDIPSTLL